jgi:hypothetical protein
MDFVCHLGTPEGRWCETRAAADETVLRAEPSVRPRIFAIERRLGLAMPTELLARLRRRRRSFKTLMVFVKNSLLKAGFLLLQALNLMLERLGAEFQGDPDASARPGSGR